MLLKHVRASWLVYAFPLFLSDRLPCQVGVLVPCPVDAKVGLYTDEADARHFIHADQSGKRNLPSTEKNPRVVNYAPFMDVPAGADRLNMIRDKFQMNTAPALFMFDVERDVLDTNKAQLLCYKLDTKLNPKKKGAIACLEAHQLKHGRDPAAVRALLKLTNAKYEKFYKKEGATVETARLKTWEAFQVGPLEAELIAVWDKLKEPPSDHVFFVQAVRREAVLPLPAPPPPPALPVPLPAPPPAPLVSPASTDNGLWQAR